MTLVALIVASWLVLSVVVALALAALAHAAKRGEGPARLGAAHPLAPVTVLVAGAAPTAGAPLAAPVPGTVSALPAQRRASAALLSR